MSARFSLRTLAVVCILVVVCFTITASAAPQKNGKGGKGKKETLVLDLSMDVNQIAAAGSGSYINLFAYDGEGYALSWKSKALKGRRYYDSAWIGDVNNDGVDEVVGFCGMLSIYEDGSTGESSYFGGSFSGYSRTSWLVMGGDVLAGHEGNEVVVNLGDHVEVWTCDDIPECEKYWGSTGVTPYSLSSLEIGDANNDPDNVNDIVVGTRSTGRNAYGSVQVYESTSSGWLPVVSEPFVDLKDQGSSAATVTAVSVDDVDDDGDNEIVATLMVFGETFDDTETWLAIWKHNSTAGAGEYEYFLWETIPLEALAVGFSGTTVDTGDFDGDGIVEIFVGLNQGAASRVEILKFDGYDWTTTSTEMMGGPIAELRVGNTDDDLDLELVVAVGPAGDRIQIWDWDYDSDSPGFIRVFTSGRNEGANWISIQ